MPDSTNAGTPTPGVQLQGDATVRYAIKRIQRQQLAQQKPQRAGVTTGPAKPPKIKETGY